MTPNEILDTLKLLDIKISRKTLYNWEKSGVISAAIFRNSRTAEYPPETFAETYAAYIFTQVGIEVPLFDFNVKIALDAVIKIRTLYYMITKFAEENNLSPWDNEADLNKYIRTEFKGTPTATRLARDFARYHNIYYWPKQYYIQISEAEHFLKTQRES